MTDDHEPAAVDTADDLRAALAASEFVDADAPEVVAFARRAVGDETDPVKQAIRLFYAVRDGIWYSPYSITDDPADYRASAIAGVKATYCVPKAVLLAAAARAVGIPARVGFADVRNHLTSEKLRRRMGTDLFMWHGYTALYLDGRWFKVTPAFNAELCDAFGVVPLDFDGTADALFHEFTTGGERHMEYVTYRGEFDDLPYEEMMGDFRRHYGGMLEPSSRADSETADRFSRPDQPANAGGSGSSTARPSSST
jgi:transglutaminase-like putative cysteine protease